jgi:O-antigen ligase
VHDTLTTSIRPAERDTRTWAITDVAVPVGAVLLAGATLTLLAAIAREHFTDLFFPLVVVAAAVAIARPWLGLLAAVAVSPTFGWVVTGPDVSAFQLLLPATAIGVAFRHRHNVVPTALMVLRRPPVALAVMFVCWLAIAALANHGRGDLSFVKSYVGSVLFLVLAAMLLQTARRRTVLIAVMLAAITASAVVGLVQIFTIDALVSAWVVPSVRVVQDTYLRLASPWGFGSVGSDFAKDMLVGFVVCVPFLAAARPGPTRRTLGAMAVVVGVALVMSGGRSAWLAGLAAIGYLVLVHLHSRVTVAALVAVGVVLALCVARPNTALDLQTVAGLDAGAQQYVPPSTASRPAKRLQVGGQRSAASTELSDSLRRRLTTAGLKMIRDHPLVGVGPGAFKDFVDIYDPAPANEPADSRANLPAHDVILEITSDSGIPAALLYVGFLGALMLGLERRRRAAMGADRTIATAVSAGIIALFITSLFHNYQGENLLWALAGVGLALSLWPETVHDPAPGESGEPRMLDARAPGLEAADALGSRRGAAAMVW